jgi:hypothetical protein
MNQNWNEEFFLYVFRCEEATPDLLNHSVNDLIRLAASGQIDKDDYAILKLFKLMVTHPALSLQTFNTIINDHLFYIPLTMYLTYSTEIREDFRREIYKNVMDVSSSKWTEEIMKRFFSESAMFPQETNKFIKWYDETYNMEVKLADLPKNMVPITLGWE